MRSRLSLSYINISITLAFKFIRHTIFYHEMMRRHTRWKKKVDLLSYYPFKNFESKVAGKRQILLPQHMANIFEKKKTQKVPYFN